MEKFLIAKGTPHQHYSPLFRDIHTFATVGADRAHADTFALGFTFSFPTLQTSINRGSLIR